MIYYPVHGIMDYSASICGAKSLWMNYYPTTVPWTIVLVFVMLNPYIWIIAQSTVSWTTSICGTQSTVSWTILLVFVVLNPYGWIITQSTVSWTIVLVFTESLWVNYFWHFPAPQTWHRGLVEKWTYLHDTPIPG